MEDGRKRHWARAGPGMIIMTIIRWKEVSSRCTEILSAGPSKSPRHEAILLSKQQQLFSALRKFHGRSGSTPTAYQKRSWLRELLTQIFTVYGSEMKQKCNSRTFHLLQTI